MTEFLRTCNRWSVFEIIRRLQGNVGMRNRPTEAPIGLRMGSTKDTAWSPSEAVMEAIMDARIRPTTSSRRAADSSMEPIRVCLRSFTFDPLLWWFDPEERSAMVVPSEVAASADPPVKASTNE
ncbi:hypothetical protein FRC03_003126 [Tulasnella sp. 419]|nr:hypothetical protein FRC03_003126 [Tulasnella sp. 419]